MTTIAAVDILNLPIDDVTDSRGKVTALRTRIPTADPTLFLSVRTHHWGKADYAGPAEYVIICRANGERVGTNFVLSAPFSGALVHRVPDVKRRTAKAMRDAHKAALAIVATVLDRDPHAFDKQLAETPADRD